MAKVSILVPVYNVEQYLEECLDSIQNQTLEDIEIICIDDGSTDSSAQILDTYAQRDNRFHVIHKQNEGYGKAMNVGLSLACSPYVGIVESDDYIERDMYEKLYALMEEKQADVIKADYYEFYNGENGKRIERYLACISETRLRRYMPLSQETIDKTLGLYDVIFNIRQHEEAFLFEKYTWSGLYRREFLENEQILHNETPGASYQDNGFWFQTMVKAKRLYFTKQAFYHYRIDNLNSSIHSRAKVFAVCDEYEFVYNILNEMGDDGARFYKWDRFFKLLDCIDNVGRVADEYQKDLVDRIREEFLLAEKKGEIDFDLYADHWKSKLFDILFHGDGYVEKIRKRAQKIDESIQNFDVIIIYGAGKLGQAAYWTLVGGRRNIKVKYYGVTQAEGNPGQVLGVPVKCIDELQEYREQALVIIAVGKTYTEEVKRLLIQKNFLHFILYSDMCN